ncbi:MAG: phage integrase SAM-like domain-containing protein [Bacteroidales bacterium]
MSDLPLDKIDTDFVRGFDLYLKTVQNCQQNSAMKHVKNLKKNNPDQRWKWLDESRSVCKLQNQDTKS